MAHAPTQPDLAIIIVNWNTRQLLLDCLAAIPAATPGITAEIWVVDNGSTDGSVTAVQSYHPEVRIIANRDNKGFAAANNQAIRASDSRHVLLLNSDTVARPGSLTALARFLDAHPEVGMVGSRLLNPDGSLQPSWAMFPSIFTELVGKKLRLRWRYPTRDGSRAYSTDWVDGAVLMIRRSILPQVGLMDEHYFMYSEEVDWCYRTRRAGYQICYLPDAEVVHLGGQSSKQAATRMKYELYRSKLRFFNKHYGRPVATLFGLGLQMIFLGKATIGGAVLAVTAARHPVGRAFARDGGLLLAALGSQVWNLPRGEQP
ncbi:MAG: glycosyltransferase family 2 protein [Chloroflexaceae bacterium]